MNSENKCEFFPEASRTFECADNLQNGLDMCIDYYDEYIEIDGVIVNKAEWEKTNKIKKEEVESNMPEMEAETIATSSSQHDDSSPIKSRYKKQSNLPSRATKNTRNVNKCERETKIIMQLKDEHNYSVPTPDEPNKWFKCNYCGFKTKEKSDLKREKLLYLPGDRLRWFECEHCEYQTKFKCGLKTHMIMQNPDDQTTWFQCDQCAYETKSKSSLKRHEILIHLSNGRVKWFECDHCEYKTKVKSNLTSHMKVHTKDDEMKWFECDRRLQHKTYAPSKSTPKTAFTR